MGFFRFLYWQKVQLITLYLLHMDNKHLYAEVCAQHYLPLFFQPWWLDTVCGSDRWDAIISTDKGGNPVGVLPYHTTKKLGMDFVMMPMLTPCLGPWLLYPEEQKLTNRYSFEKKVLTDLLRQLPSCTFYRQHFHYSQQGWLPFYWAGYRQTTRYTYVLNNIKEHDQLLRNIKSNIRNKINKGKHSIYIKTGDNIDKFYDVNTLTFARQGLQIPYTKDFFDRIDTELSSRGQRKIFFGYNDKQQLCGAVYIVWDAKSAYCLAMGKDPSIQASEVIPTLLWEAIRYVSDFVDVFDFEGSMLESVEQLFNSFGAERKAYHAVYKSKNILINTMLRIRYPHLV